MVRCAQTLTGVAPIEYVCVEVSHRAPAPVQRAKLLTNVPAGALLRSHCGAAPPLLPLHVVMTCEPLAAEAMIQPATALLGPALGDAAAETPMRIATNEEAGEAPMLTDVSPGSPSREMEPPPDSTAPPAVPMQQPTAEEAAAGRARRRRRRCMARKGGGGERGGGMNGGRAVKP